MRLFLARGLAILAGLLAVAAAGVTDGTVANCPPGKEPAAQPATVHQDAAALERLTMDALRALLRGETGTVRGRLDRMVELEGNPASRAEEEEPHEVRTYRTALFVTINRARESAGRGDIEQAFNDFVWVQRSCVMCHDVVRTKALEAGGGAAGDGS